MKGKQIRETRINYRIRQKDFAKLMGISQPYLSQIENEEFPITAEVSKAYNKVVKELILTPKATLGKVRIDVKKEIVATELKAHNEHYQVGNIDVFAFAEENFKEEEVIGFYQINAIKYITRFGKKGGYNQDDLDKAVVYINKLRQMTGGK